MQDASPLTDEIECMQLSESGPFSNDIAQWPKQYRDYAETALATFLDEHPEVTVIRRESLSFVRDDLAGAPHALVLRVKLDRPV